MTTLIIAWGASLQPGRGLVMPGMALRLRNSLQGEGTGWLRAHQSFKPAWRQTFAQVTELQTYSTGLLDLQPSEIVPESIVSDRVRRLAMPWIDGGRAWPTLGIENFTLNEYGWPWRAVSSRNFVCGSVNTWDGLINLSSLSWFSKRPMGEPWGLPRGIVWPAFIGDTAVWSVPWAGGLIVVPAWKRRRRVRKGLCPSCAYDMRGAAAGTPCPECGWDAIHA